MNKNAMKLLKNISYTVGSNLLSLIVSTVITLIIPKLIGIEAYGYWQLYLFYVSYIGFLHFGWNDGIYLRYGGKKYEMLDKKILGSQFVMLFASQLFFSIIILIFNNQLNTTEDKNFIIKMISIALVLTNVRFFFMYILQATNRIKQYANITIMDRLIYVILLIVFLALGIRDYRIMILADLLGRLFSLIFAVNVCKEISLVKIKDFEFNLSETYENIRVGSKLMVANIASMLIVGIVRFGIERAWDVTTFGKVSLTLSISNMMMIFINAIGIIMFPILRQTDQKNLAIIYSTIRNLLMVLLLGILLIYYPLKTMMAIWLPQYEESLLYMALVFPIFIYEGKMALLINTYFKTLRKEKYMLQINIITMLMSLVMTFITTRILKNLDIAIVSIVVLLAFRSIIAERYLSRELNIRIKKDVLLEIFVSIVFILSGWLINSWATALYYSIAYFIYLIIKRKDVKNSINLLRIHFKSKEE